VRFIPYPPKIIASTPSLSLCRLLYTAKSPPPSGYVLGFGFGSFEFLSSSIKSIHQPMRLLIVFIGLPVPRCHLSCLILAATRQLVDFTHPCDFVDAFIDVVDFWVCIFIYTIFFVFLLLVVFSGLVCEDSCYRRLVCFSDKSILETIVAFLSPASFWMSCSMLARGLPSGVFGICFFNHF
jgi:hypothetical protein